MRFLSTCSLSLACALSAEPVYAGEPGLRTLFVPPEPQPTEEPQPSTEAHSKRFAETYGRGVEKYKQGEYAIAVEAFMDAYQIRPQPRLLFNIAQCHRKQNALRESILYFEKYLAADPNSSSEVRAEVQAYISELRAKQHAQELSQKPDKVIVIAKEKPVPRAYVPIGVASGVLGVGGVAVGAAFIGISGTCVESPQPPALECTRLYNSLTPGIAITAVGGSLAVIGTVFVSLSARRPKVEKRAIESPSDALLSAERNEP